MEHKRASFWWEALHARLWGALVIVWALFANAATFRDNFLSKAAQAKFQVLDYLPRFHWRDVVIGVLILIILCSAEGAFHLYRTQHRRAEAEIEKHKSPDIRGEVIIAFWDSPRDPNTGYKYPSRYYVKLRLVNHADVSCTISEYRMCFPSSLDGGDHPISQPGFSFISGVIRHNTNFVDELTSVGPDGSQTNPINISAISSPWPLARACERMVWVQFDIPDHVPDFRDDGPNCIQEIFWVVVIDSLGKPHTIEAPFATVCLGKLDNQ
jgi:hypothetical protein